MSVDEKMLTEQLPTRPPVAFRAPKGPRRRRPGRRLRKLRIFSIAVAFGTLGLISAVFGMLMSVAADLPALTITAQRQANLDSYLYDDTGKPIGVLAAPGQPGDDTWKQISPAMVHAIVAVEDRRFWSDPGFDLKGIVRAALSDLTGGPHQGASTIAEQFVKVKLREENSRTIFEKLREAALAFQLVHRWHRTVLLTDYLNSIYFGNGAIGVESAARIYFGDVLGYDPNNPAQSRCGDATVQDPDLPKCAKLLQPYQAALLAGMVANPTAFNPLLDSRDAEARRDLVLQDMVQQHYITRNYYDQYSGYPVPDVHQIQQPTEPALAPYFTAWVRPQILDALQHGAGIRSEGLAQYEAYYGGLKIRLTINLALQQAAQNTVDTAFAGLPNPPTASLVAIDNQTGEVRAMVSGNGNFEQSPFNLATQGHRQPGSSFKLFTLAAALSSGKYGPYSVIDSHPLDIPFKGPHGVIGYFKVHNFGNFYSGPMSLAAATAVSDNTVFAQVGMSVGTKSIRDFARRMGIRSPVSTNPSMILGGLNTGVSALDMAHAYETVATGGLKVHNRILGDTGEGPIGIHSIVGGCQGCAQLNIVNEPTRTRVVSPEVAATIKQLLAGVVGPGGTGGQAAIPGVEVVGKTGTTSNYVDAWFVGWTPQMTTAVWVGYPNGAVPMLTQWQGQPVEGGTYPAVIWRNFMESALQILAQQSAKPATVTTQVPPPSSTVATGPIQSTTTPSATTTTPSGTATTGDTSTTGATGPGPGAAGGTSSTPGGGPAGGGGSNGQGAGGTGAAGAPASPGAGSAAGTPGAGAGSGAAGGAVPGGAVPGGGTTGAGSGSATSPAPTPGTGGPSGTGTTGGAGLGG